MSSQLKLADDTPLDPDDELLVAYLDGELDAKSESELIDRLVGDQRLNRRLQQLQEGWDWLDTLPPPTPNEKLVESTLELVVADVIGSQPDKPSRWTRFRWPIIVLVACLLSVAGVWIAVSLIKTSEYRQQLRDLEIAAHLDAYLRGADLTLMRRISNDPEWMQMIAAAQEIGEFGAGEQVSIDEVPLEMRTEALQRLPLEEQPKLASQWNSFQRLDEATEREVRRTAAAVAIQPDAESLLQTMDLYAIWVEKLPTELRDQIESEDRKVQREAIDRAIEITQESTMQRSRDRLSDEAVDRIYFALREILQQRLDAGDQKTIEHLEAMTEMTNRWSFNVDPEPFTIMAIAIGRDSQGSGFRGRRSPFGRIDSPDPLQERELEMIRLILPDEAHDLLEVISSAVSLEDTLTLRNFTLRSWAEAAAQQKLPRRPETTLLDRYNEESPIEREKLDLLPPEVMLERLTPSWPRR